MRIELDTKPSGPTIIIGFPGVGLVGPIVTEFLIDHMKTEMIGKFFFDELPAVLPIHKGKVVHPMAIHYSEKHNTIIVYTILNLKGQEWKVADVIHDLANEVGAKEIICIDGATSPDATSVIYAYGNERMQDFGAQMLQESVLIGITGALLLRTGGVNCIFASTHMEMPDSKAAAEVVKFLDKYMGLEVDYHPLLDQAKQFEEKLKTVMTQSKSVLDEQDRKSMDYLG